jgi:hypothetical protein
MAKKLKKAQKPTAEDKAVKAKRTGYRFKTEGNPKLHNKDGDLNAKGKSLYFKKPSKQEIEKFKKEPDGTYPDKVKQIYHERRADRKHSDDNLTKKFKGGGDVKQNPAQSESYSKKNDKGEKAKPVGKRYTDKLAKKLHKSPNATPTQKDVEKYLGNGVYDEKRKDKSDFSLTKKLEEGDLVTNEISCEEMKAILGRDPKYPRDFINGKKYEKCFLRPYYRCCE